MNGGVIQFEYDIKIPKNDPPPHRIKNRIFSSLFIFFWSIFDISIENSIILYEKCRNDPTPLRQFLLEKDPTLPGQSHLPPKKTPPSF